MIKIIFCFSVLVLVLSFANCVSAQVGIVPIDDPPFFGFKLTHLASHDYVVIACDKRTGETVMRTKQGIVFSSFNYNEILDLTSKANEKFCSFVEGDITKTLAIKYQIASFNTKLAKLYGRL
jgi:hypothetical protein